MVWGQVPVYGFEQVWGLELDLTSAHPNPMSRVPPSPIMAHPGVRVTEFTPGHVLGTSA